MRRGEHWSDEEADGLAWNAGLGAGQRPQLVQLTLYGWDALSGVEKRHTPSRGRGGGDVTVLRRRNRELRSVN